MDENLNLLAIGKALVEKCKGLPLAARTLGVLLRGKEREEEWEDVLNSRIWWEDSEILPALRLSYNHLPSHLKTCFAYCSILPQDYEFTEKELVLLWMAEGFFQQGEDSKQLEDIGHSYFHELLSRSFFQPSTTKGGLKSFLMQDLINDLAQLVSGDLSFRIEDKLEGKYKNIGRARHSSVYQGYYDGMKKFEKLYEAKHLRTFLPFSLSGQQYYSLAADVPSLLFPKLRCLRTLSLRSYRNFELVDSIGHMKHLRYLDLSFTRIKELPDWVQEFYNLQTLLLRECKLLEKLPKNMGNLAQLRHFDVTNSYRLREMPQGIGNMEDLHMLSDFIVTKDNGSRIKELGKLKHIGETLRLSGLQNVTDPMDGRGVYLSDKKNLDILRFEYGETSRDVPNEEFEREVLHTLQPHDRLKELYIYKYHGTSFPTWLGNPLFMNMVHIEIEHCENCSVLPPLGQLKSLKELNIIGMSGVKHVGREFYGYALTKPFPALEVLRFQDMLGWEDWFDFGADEELRPFDHVTRLLIINCPELVGKLPSTLPRLENLEIEKCKKLAVDFEGLVYPSITSLFVDGIELPLNPSKLNNMNNTLLSSCLSSLRLRNVSVPDSLWGTSIFGQNLNSVTDLTFENIQNLVCIPKWLAFNLTALKQLKIESCKELETLLDDSNCEAMPLELHELLPALQQLSIRSCPQFVSLFFEEEENVDGESQGNQESKAVQSFMPKLESLTIVNCDKLGKLSRGLSMLTCLVNLEVHWCDNLVSLPEAGFPSTLKTLYFLGCMSLESPLPCWNEDNNLENVSVFYCSSLTSLFTSSCNGNIGTCGLPSSLYRLEIGDCEKLETLVSRKETKIHCPSLKSIEISDCDRLKYLPDPHCGDSLGNLKELDLSECKDLQGFSDGWLRAITNLRKITISKGTEGGGGGMTVFSHILKEAGFLTNLTSLCLGDMTTNVHPSEWGLHRLSSLTYLKLSGLIRDEEGEVVKVSVFPLDGMLLPTSLTILEIVCFPDLERLSSKGFECLTSLERLSLWRCPRLEYLPKGGFPDTLLGLFIDDCPLLKKKCEKGKGEYWPIISRIPIASTFSPS